jgi:hypothetical protein
VVLGDDPRANIVNVAMSQIGYCEGDSTQEISGCTPGTKNYTEYGLWYNNLQEKPGGFEKGAWCAMFVSWCAQQAGISSEVMYYHAYTVFGLSWFQERNLSYTRQQVEDGLYLPQPGDIVYFKSARNNSGKHCSFFSQFYFSFYKLFSIASIISARRFSKNSLSQG